MLSQTSPPPPWIERVLGDQARVKDELRVVDVERLAEKRDEEERRNTAEPHRRPLDEGANPREAVGLFDHVMLYW